MAEKNHIELVKTTYKQFEEFLQRKGIFLAKDTGIGYWGVTPLQELHDFFMHLNLGKHKHLLDLGSGDGRVVLLAAALGITATGVEADDWLMQCAQELKRKINHPSMQNATFLSYDFMKLNIGAYDLVYVSPYKPFHRGLERKLIAELNGTLIVHSYEFLPSALKLQTQFKAHGELFSMYKK